MKFTKDGIKKLGYLAISGISGSLATYLAIEISKNPDNLTLENTISYGAVIALNGITSISSLRHATSKYFKN